MNAKKIASTVLSMGVVIAVAVGFKLYNMAGASSEVQEEVYAILPQLTDHTRDPAYFRTLVDENHEEVFKRSYDAGGRRRAATFERKQYFGDLHAAMVEQAQRDGRSWVGRSLRRGKQLFVAAGQR